ncbi:glycine--tRNA ligase subunit beta [Sphingomonas sp. MMS24-J13]|uniref:glycine--tRNA ligase subunit beta n=1 Tax=Sphingomonas sp. MMS24-J13 TaxID=3238686 RepID=UPI00384F551B
MTDFLLELRSEEIPARMQERARADLEKLFVAELAAAGLAATQIVTYATPRRLALIAYGLPEQTEAVREETKGPRASPPPQALEGFLRKTGLTADQLVERDGVLFAVIDKPGRATADVLSAAIPAIVRAFPWPKAMRWGAASASTESPRWVRPLQGVVAILGEDVLEFEVAGVASAAATVGHRFHHPGMITIGGASDYVEKLRACHVIVDGAERRAIIADGAVAATRAAGLELVEDEGLLFENAGLTEWPVPLPGRFDEAFLDVPPEVIQLTARVNQKYFVCRDSGGKLANAFVCCANIEAADGGAKIVEGNRKVLAARLSDARFFYETDLRTSLAEQAKKLDKIVFHEKLGTVADKVARVAKLAEWLAAEGIVPGADPQLARQAAELSKADLVTGMVGEFPELQGLMGGYYARAEGLPDAVADAIRDHYKPVGQGDDVPTAPVTVAVSLADKLDTIAAFFAVGEKPTGSKDPFALRRAALGIASLILDNGLRFAALPVLRKADFPFAEMQPGSAASFEQVMAFLIDRLKVQQREAGVRHDLIDAVFALGGEDDLVRLLARVKALQAFVTTDDGANLLAGYKRAANILKKEGFETAADPGKTALSYMPEAEEADLLAALETAESAAGEAVARERFEEAMAALATLRAPIDAFFDKVTVNDADPDKRAARLAMLTRVRAACNGVADFSKIEG